MSDSTTKIIKQMRFPRAKIMKALHSVVPANRPFTLRTSKSSVGDARIVRVITDAWKTQRPAERIFKVLSAVNKQLTEKELQSVLRFSVLTDKEYRSVVAEK